MTDVDTCQSSGKESIESSSDVIVDLDSRACFSARNSANAACAAVDRTRSSSSTLLVILKNSPQANIYLRILCKYILLVTARTVIFTQKAYLVSTQGSPCLPNTKTGISLI